MNVITYAIIGVFILGGLWFFDKKQSTNECNDRALAAAIDTYPISEYPDANERDILQKGYIEKYKQSC